MENPIKMDDLGVPLFSETSKYGVIPEKRKVLGCFNGGFPFCWNKLIDLRLGGLFYWFLHSQISSDPETLKLRANQKGSIKKHTPEI